jgi:epsilon-lactone hydrolase
VSLRIRIAQRVLITFVNWYRKKPYDLAAQRRLGLRTERATRIARGVVETEKTIAGVRVHEYTSGSGQLGLVLHFHGGAYVAGSSLFGRTYSKLVANGGPDLISIDYRLAPEHPYPAGVDDAVAVYRSLLPRPMVIMGESAGGGMVLALAQRLHQEGLPMPAGIVALFPWSDLTQSSVGFTTNAGRDALAKSDLDTHASEYAGDLNVRTPGISPSFGSFEGFPPTTIIVGEYDSLIGDSRDVYQHLKDAGASVALTEIPGTAHGFVSLNVPETRQALSVIAAFVRRVLPG